MIELFNSDNPTPVLHSRYTLSEIEDFVKSKKKLVFTLKGYNKDKLFLEYKSLYFNNVCNRLISEFKDSIDRDINDKYTITMEEE